MRGQTERIRANQVAAFRLARHHLLASHVRERYAGEPGSARLAQVVGDVCGIQAQVMSAAELALWTRMHGLTRGEIPSALWKDRVLVKTSCMRQALHLLPGSEFHIFMGAVRHFCFEKPQDGLGRIFQELGLYGKPSASPGVRP